MSCTDATNKINNALHTPDDETDATTITLEYAAYMN